MNRDEARLLPLRLEKIKLQTETPAFPNKKYNIIYADPHWSYSDNGCNGNTGQHYLPMKDADICALPVKDIAADDCVLFIWATCPKLKEVLDVTKVWGFTYKTIGFQWVKHNRSGNGRFFGLGRWTSGNTESCFISTKSDIYPVIVNDEASARALFLQRASQSAPAPALASRCCHRSGLTAKIMARSKTISWSSPPVQLLKTGTAGEMRQIQF